MNAIPPLTVLMPVYNGGPYLKEAVASVLGQSHGAFTFLIIDDGSTDGSLDWLRSLDDPRIVLETNMRNLGLIATLNLGLEMIDTPYFCRADADDLCEPRRFERQIAFMEAHPELGAAGSDVLQFGEGIDYVSHYVTDPDQIRAMLLFQPTLCHASAIFRTALFKAHGIRYRAAYPHIEDWDLWRQIAVHAPLGNQPELLYKVRNHPQGVQARNAEQQADAIRRLQGEELDRLGIDCTEEERAFHAAVGAFRFSGELTELERAEGWLRQLLAAREGSDDPWFAGLEQEIGRRFWRLARNHFAAAGLGAWRIYRGSPLRRLSPASFKEEAWFFLLTLRASLR